MSQITSDDVRKFLELPYDKKVDYSILILSTLGCGFLIILVLDPHYFKALHTATLCILAVFAGFLVWSLNQILWWCYATRLIKEFSKRLVTFLGWPNDVTAKVQNLIDEYPGMLYKFASAPFRQIGGVITIVCTVLGAITAHSLPSTWVLPYVLYLVAFASSYLLTLLVGKAASFGIQRLTPRHLTPLWRKLKRDKRFVAAVERLLNRAEYLLRKKDPLKGKALRPEKEPSVCG